jgi:transcriptional regulator with XRE-family HTH domain
MMVCALKFEEQSEQEQFGAWLKAERERLRMTRAHVSGQAGISEQQLWRIETGETGSKRETLRAIARAMRLDEGDVLERAGFSARSYVTLEGMNREIKHPHHPEETRELHDDEREAYDRWYFLFEGEPGFSKLSPSEKDALVRRAVEAERQPNTFKPGDFRRAVEEAQKQRQSEE